MPRAGPEQAEPHLRILQGCDGVQKLLACMHPLLGMLIYIVRSTNGSAKQIKVAKHTAIPLRICKQLGREIGGEGSSRGGPDSNQLTLVQVQSQPKRPRSLLNGLKALANRGDIAAHHSIIQVEDGKGHGSSQLLRQGLDGRCKQQGPQRIPLLHTSSRGDDSLPSKILG